MAASLEQMIMQLMNPDNNVRGQAELAFENAMSTQPDQLLLGLLNVLVTSTTSVKAMAAVLFRRYAFENEKMLWNQCPPQTQIQLKSILLQALIAEQDRSVRQKICHAISTTGKFVEGNWPELLPCMFECCKSENEQHREAALEIFSNLPTMFGDSLSRYISVLKEIFQKSLVDPSPKVQLASLRATIAFLMVIEDDSQRNFFADLLPSMFQVIAISLNTKDEDSTRDAISSFIDLAEYSPFFLRRALDSLVPAMGQISSTTTIDDSVRHLAIELLVTLAEKAPAMIRKFKPFVEITFPSCWSLMVDLDDDSEWHTTDDLDDDEMDSNPVVGEQAVDRIACALGGKTVLPYSFSVIPNMLQNPDWKHRYAALMTISAIGEGCEKVMNNQLDNILNLIINHLNDPHPRVRYALCNAIGQMSTDFAPKMQESFHAQIVPTILRLMEDTGNPRVQAHAAAALVNFSEEASKEVLQPYLDSILSKLFHLIQTPEKRYVLEQAITTIATVADSAEDKFLNYYDTFMPVLVDILSKANGKEYRLLRGKAIECISLIGLAVGKQKFAGDAKKVMEILMSAQASEMEADDPQISYMLSSWARIAAVLGEDFIPYLPVVMPPLLRSATIKPDLAIINSDDETNNYDPADGWEFVTFEDQKIGIKTSNLEEKCTAVEMLYCYAKELKAGFHQYAHTVLDIVVPLLKFYFDDSVRMAAAATISPLLKSVQLANYDPQFIGGMWLYAVDPLLDVLKSETEPEVISKLFEGFYQCVETMGDNCLDDARLSKFCGVISAQITEAFERDKKRLEIRQDEDYDEEVEEALEDEDMNDKYTLREISESIHYVFKTHKEKFFPHFQTLLPLISEMIQPQKPGGERQWAICIFDDVIEFCGPLSATIKPYFLPHIVNGILDEVPEVRQAAVYGIGVCGRYGGTEYATTCAESIPKLIQLITAPGSREEDNINATENAISAFAKIIEFNSSQFDASQALSTWVNLLPILSDADEADYVYDFLCRLIENNNTAVLGPNNSNLPNIFKIFAEVIAMDVLEDFEATSTRIINLMKTIQSQVPEDFKNVLWANVPDQHKQKVYAFMQ